MLRKILIGLVAVLVVLLGAGVIFKDRLERLYFVTTLFTGAEQYERFNRVDELFPNAVLTPSPTPYSFETAAPVTLPAHFRYKDADSDTDQFLKETDTAALVVLKDGKIVYENYWLTGGRDVTWLSMSVSKSFVATLVGIAVSEGRIQSIDDPVTVYAPSLKGSAYDGVSIKDILQMSSGAAWTEDYSDPNSDVMRFGQIFAVGGSLNEFLTTMKPDREPGTHYRYNSAETQVLGLLLTRATGRSVTQYMTEKLWHPMGAEQTGHWLVDSEGMEMVFGGLSITARDYAKIGELYRNGGYFNGRQIVPADWITASVTPDAPHLAPGVNPDFPFGYGYQWWVPESLEGEYSAIGVYNQFVYVNPSRGLTIVKLSANSDYGTTDDETSWREMETLALFRAIGEAVETSQQ